MLWLFMHASVFRKSLNNNVVCSSGGAYSSRGSSCSFPLFSALLVADIAAAGADYVYAVLESGRDNTIIGEIAFVDGDGLWAVVGRRCGS